MTDIDIELGLLREATLPDALAASDTAIMARFFELRARGARRLIMLSGGSVTLTAALLGIVSSTAPRERATDVTAPLVQYDRAMALAPAARLVARQ